MSLSGSVPGNLRDSLSSSTARLSPTSTLRRVTSGAPPRTSSPRASSPRSSSPRPCSFRVQSPRMWSASVEPVSPYTGGIAYAARPERFSSAVEPVLPYTGVVYAAAPEPPYNGCSGVVYAAAPELSPCVVEPAPQVVMVRAAEPDWRAEFFLLRKEVDQLRQQIGTDLGAVSARVAVLEASPWVPRMQEAESLINHSISAINDLALRIEALEAGPQETDLECRVREIDARGNVRFDMMTGRMQVLREIAFVPLRSSDQPVAKLRDPRAASEVIDDIAAIASLFENNVLTIEGHTGGGDNDFWQELADDRARLVGQQIVSRGLRADNIQTIGKPGKTGLNRSEVVVKLTMTPEEIQTMRQHIIKRGNPSNPAAS